jgi:cytoskeletal protein CcmA (bactofilin family)
MFKSNDEEYKGVEDTVIGNSIKIEGDLVSNGSIVIEGEVMGSVKTASSLRIGDRAKVVANVEANDALISGKVDGNVIVQDKLELLESAEVNGDIQAKTVIIAAGAVFNGKCTMSGGHQNSSAEKQEVDGEE